MNSDFNLSNLRSVMLHKQWSILRLADFSQYCNHFIQNPKRLRYTDIINLSYSLPDLCPRLY